MSHNYHSASGHIVALRYTDQQKRDWVKSTISTGGHKCQLPNPKVIINVCNIGMLVDHKPITGVLTCFKYVEVTYYYKYTY